MGYLFEWAALLKERKLRLNLVRVGSGPGPSFLPWPISLSHRGPLRIPLLPSRYVTLYDATSTTDSFPPRSGGSKRASRGHISGSSPSLALARSISSLLSPSRRQGDTERRRRDGKLWAEPVAGVGRRLPPPRHCQKQANIEGIPFSNRPGTKTSSSTSMMVGSFLDLRKAPSAPRRRASSSPSP